ENLRHLVANLGPDARRSHIIPFLTSKHTLEYCLRYAERAHENGFRTLVVLGGDRHDGVPRCVEHASELRSMMRKRVPGRLLEVGRFYISNLPVYDAPARLAGIAALSAQSLRPMWTGQQV